MNAVAERHQPSDGLVTPAQMLAVAVQQGADLAKLEKLIELQERWERNQARKAFDLAMSAAKAEIRPIVKNRQVDYAGKGGGKTNYAYEDFAQVAACVDPALSKHGLSYRFRSKQEGKTLTVVCVLSHRDGHSEETSLLAPNDESGNKNSIQSIGSAATYLQRYTLKLALGLAAGLDDDAHTHGRHRPAGAEPEPEPAANGEANAALPMLRTELGSLIRRTAELRKLEPDYVFAKLRDMVRAKWPDAADTTSAWDRDTLRYALDSMTKSLAAAEKAAAEKPAEREPGIDPEDEQGPDPSPTTTAAPSEPQTDAPVRESKIPPQLVNQIFGELQEAGISWPAFLGASVKAVGRQLPPNFKCKDLLLTEGARAIEWAKRVKAEKDKARRDAEAVPA